MNTETLNQLLKSLTLKEKIGQLVQLAPFLFKENIIGEITGPMNDIGITNEDILVTGNVLGIGGAEEMKYIQKDYLEKSEKKIPLMFMADIIHGYRTIFPIPLALGGSFNPQMVEKTARIAAKEASAGGVHVTFSPMADLVRDPRWGRVMESPGEDPYLNGVIAEAFVKGYQGENVKAKGSIAACVKHFAAYGAAEAGRDYNTVDISKRMLHEFYLPAYKKALDAGAKMVMTSFNIVDSIPATGNKWLMRDVLREQWNFNGVTISDYGSVEEMIEHGTSEDQCDAAKQAIEAGLDIEMMSGAYHNHLEQLVKTSVISEALIDEAVQRVLELKNELGLFENPYKDADEALEASLILSKEHKEAAEDAAIKSCVLLENNGLLPIKKDANIMLMGPYADEHDIIGPWHWQGRKEDTVSLKQGVEALLNQSVEFYQAADIDGNLTNIETAIEAAKTKDLVILALGEHERLSGEGGSRTSITLPNDQIELARALKANHVPFVTVLFNGRPLDLTELQTLSDATVEAWFPGTEGGHAIAKLLYGETNFSAKLSMSFPRNVGQIPVYYNYFNTGRPKQSNQYNRYVSHFLDCENTPLYPFGYGLSYSHFDIEVMGLSGQYLKEDETLKAKVKVTNHSAFKGTETIQLYIKDDKASVVRPEKELKSFKQLTLEPNETQTVVFDIDEAMLKFYNVDLEEVVEPGLFKVFIGNISTVTEYLTFTYEKA